MITASQALALETAQLTPEEQRQLAQLDASVESAIYAHFKGGPFGFVVTPKQGSAKVVVALKRMYESASDEGGWCWKVDVSTVPEGLGALQLVFTPEVSRGRGPVVVREQAPRPARVRMDKPRVCLVSDVRGWAFDQNFQDLASYLVEQFDFEHFYVAEWLKGARINWGDFDIIYEAYHRNPPMGIPRERSLSALRTQLKYFRSEMPDSLEDSDYALVNKFRGFQVTTEIDRDTLLPRCPRVVYLTNPVNTRRFEQTPARSNIIAEWNGNPGHQAGNGEFIKHFRDIVEPACEKVGVQLVAAEYGVKDGPRRQRTRDEMPGFYQQANVALCASSVEGASNSVMEAMASGLAVVSTDVGNHREMRESQLASFGDSGIVLVPGTVDAFAEALRSITPKRAREMGEINRAEIIARWSWDAWKDRYADFLRMAL